MTPSFAIGDGWIELELKEREAEAEDKEEEEEEDEEEEEEEGDRGARAGLVERFNGDLLQGADGCLLALVGVPAGDR